MSETQTSTTFTTRSTTKSPIVWKKSKIVRRSVDSADTARDDESDELDNASSEREEELKGKIKQTFFSFQFYFLMKSLQNTNFGCGTSF